MAKVTVFNKSGKENGSLELPDEIFAGKVNTDVLHQAVVMYQACLRQGTASTKQRGDVSGGGIKPFRQKGTGRARAGSSRSPLWKKGGIVFGPTPRDFSYSIPKKIRRAALRESLKVKYQNQNLLCIDEVKDAFKKTKDFAGILKALKVQGRTIALLDGSNESVARVSRNIPSFHLMRAQDVNAYDILRHKKLLVTKTALDRLLERI